MRIRRWPLFVIAAPAAVAVWSGWVGLGQLCGFGLVDPLPGIVSWHLNTAITLPIGVEAYGSFALAAWLAPNAPERARAFARRSALGALALGMSGQLIYHLLAAAHAVRAPVPVVALVACLPVVTLGFGVALAHLLAEDSAPAAVAAGAAVVDGGRAAAVADELGAAADTRTIVSGLLSAGITETSELAAITGITERHARRLRKAADQERDAAADKVRHPAAAADLDGHRARREWLGDRARPLVPADA